MTAPTTTPAAERYLAEVESALADLPADERAELIDELAVHLSAVEADGDDRPLSARLGTSSAYAAELRAAAGLPAQRSGEQPWTDQVRRRIAALGQRRWSREVLAFLPQLRPAWWVLRGYLVVLIPSLQGIDGTRDFPVPAPFDSHLVGIGLVAVAVVASVALGRRRLPRSAGVAVVAANVVLGVLALGLIDDSRYRLERVVYASSATSDLAAPDRFPLTSVHGPVTNIYPYAADGTPLDGVLLYDQDGRPLRSSMQEWFADGCRRTAVSPQAADGAAVPFSYPRSYLTEPGGVGPTCPPLPAPQVPLPEFAKPAPAAPAPPTTVSTPAPAAGPRG